MSQGSTLNSKNAGDFGKKLLEAARHGDTEEVKNLLSNGAPLTTDWLGTTPLHLAAIYGHTSTAEALIKSGINQDGRTKVDKTPLHFACQHGHSDIVKLLVNGGAHINAFDMLKMTPLHWAVEADNLDICLILLNSGIKTGVKNKFGKTPLKIAQDKGYHSIVQLLMDEKYKFLREIDVLQHDEMSDRNLSSVKICRQENNIANRMVKKPAKTRRFPMVAGTWTGGEAENQERIEMSERRKLGMYKKKQQQQIQKQQQKNDHVPPLLGTLYLSTSPLNPVAVETKTTLGSPLQQLVETVQQTTLDSNLLPNLTNIAKCTTYNNDNKPLTSINKNIKSLYSGIPVISTETLKSLPANIHAIPLSMTAEEMEKEISPIDASQYVSNNKTIVSNSTNISQSNNVLNAPENCVPISKDQSKKNETLSEAQDLSKTHHLPLTIPVDLLNQIMTSDITLHSVSSSTNNPDNSTLAAIRTEMGTIPIIPVNKGEGGLQLIPIENKGPIPSSDHDQDMKDADTLLSQHSSAHPVMPNSRSISLNNNPAIHPVLRSPFLMDNSPAYTYAPVTIQNNVVGAHQTPVTSGPRSVPSSMLVPTGIYLPTNHPGFLQIHRQPSPFINETQQQNYVMPPPLFPHFARAPSSLLHAPSSLHQTSLFSPQGQQILMQPSPVTPTFLSPPQ